MTGKINNVDDLIVKDMQNAQASVQPAVQTPEVGAIKAEEPAASVPEVPRETIQPSLEVPQPEQPQNTTPPTNSGEIEGKSVDDGSNKEKLNNSPIDEYGNPVEKEKVYTEKEVQRMIQERVARAKQHEPAPQQSQQQAQPAQQQAGEENWEAQLKGLVKQTFKEIGQEERELQWKAEQAARQAEFEAKFTTGMNKYQDFHQVVAGKPITDAMIRGTMGLENPAAFVYGASKLHPQELDRISRINDPQVQAAEIGRLHERMVRNKNTISNAPRPLEQARSDIPAKPVGQRQNIDQLILQHAKQKQARGR